MKNILKILLLIIVFTLCIMGFAIASTEVPEYIRIGIYYSSSAKSSFKLSSPNGIKLGTINEDDVFESLYKVPDDETIVVTKGSTPGSVYIEGYGTIGDEDNHPYFKSIPDGDLALISIDGTDYRGNVEVRRFSKSDMTVINHLTMDEYLYGVVPREIGGNSPFEAVKAQAIVARTYATRNYGRRSELGFDLVPTVDDQAYGGYKWENENSNKAVDETYGRIVTYKGKPITGLYFSTSGGYTEDSENVWGGEFDYLKSVPDTYEPEIEGNTTWETTLTANEVKKKLKNYDINVGDVLELIPIEFSNAGRVINLKVVGTTGTANLTKAKTREAFGLKSQWYTVNSLAPRLLTGDEVSTQPGDLIDDDYVETVAKPEKVEIEEIDNTEVEDAKEVDVVEQESGDEVNTKPTDDINVTESEDGMMTAIFKSSGDSIIINNLEEKDDDTELATIEDVSVENADDEEKDDESTEKDVTTQDENTTSNEDDELVLDAETIESGENIVIEDVTKVVEGKQIGVLKRTIISLLEKILGKEFETFKNVEVEQVRFENYKSSNNDTSFTFRGRGWGHAVGMSQNGAKGMAEAGFKAEEIIKWYYTGVEVTH